MRWKVAWCRKAGNFLVLIRRGLETLYRILAAGAVSAVAPAPEPGRAEAFKFSLDAPNERAPGPGPARFIFSAKDLSSMSIAAQTTASSVATAKPGKYLAVFLDNEGYGLAVLKIREIIRLQKITPVPRMPAFVKGVINLRGRVIPVIDLRVKFGLKAEFTERTCIVVVQVQTPGAQTLAMGLIVDSVEEVVNLAENDIEPTPDFGTRVDNSYLLDMAKVKGQVKTLLDIDRVVAADAIEQIAATV
jgi:purine-binding chemotaxis protein CheW